MALPLSPLLRGTTDYADCGNCPFSRNGHPYNPVLAEFPENPVFLLVGDQPGKNEILFKRAFVGETGKIVEKMLAATGRKRSEVLITNAFLCLPTKDDPQLKEQAAKACSMRLKMELRRFPGKPILSLGGIAARAVIPKAALDAIDPPEVAPSHKRKQKNRQAALNKEAVKQVRKLEKLKEDLFTDYLKAFIEGQTWGRPLVRDVCIKFPRPKKLEEGASEAQRGANKIAYVESVRQRHFFVLDYLGKHEAEALKAIQQRVEKELEENTIESIRARKKEERAVKKTMTHEERTHREALSEVYVRSGLAAEEKPKDNHEIALRFTRSGRLKEKKSRKFTLTKAQIDKIEGKLVKENQSLLEKLQREAKERSNKVLLQELETKEATSRLTADAEEENERKKNRRKKTVGITDIAGTVFRVDVDGTGERVVIPTINPAAIMRSAGRALLGAHTPDLAFWNIVADAAKLNAIAQGKKIFLDFPGEIEWEDSDRTAELFFEFYRRALDEGSFALDLETYVEDPERHHALQAFKAKIRAIGLATKDWAISVLWDLLPSQCLSLLRYLLLSKRVSCTFHNGLYDKTVLASNGFQLNGPWQDCYVDSETEFLTELGWRKYNEIKEGTKLGTINSIGELEFQDFFSRVTKRYKGDVFIFETLHTKAVVTPNHRMWCRPLRRTSKEWRGEPLGPWQFIKAEDLLTMNTDSFEIYEACRPSNRKNGIEIDHNILRLLGLWVADGSLEFYKSEVRSLLISQEKDGNASTLLRHLANVFGIKHGKEIVHRESWRSHECIELSWRLNSALAQQFHDWCGRYSRERHLPPKAFDWSYDEKMSFLEGLFSGDGTAYESKHDRFVYRTASRRLADEVQILALSVGWSATRQPKVTADGIWHVHILRQKKITNVIRARLTGRNSRIKKKYVEDDIVCFSVPNETLITRSGSKPAFYGNTLLMHHAAFPGAAHGLQTVTAQFYGVTPWKSEFRNNEETPERLVNYCKKDTYSTKKIEAALTVWIQRTQTERIYELDKKMSACASEMHLEGVPVSREANQELLTQFFDARKESRARVEALSNDPETMKLIWHHLAFEQASKRRKLDSESFADRHKVRMSEMEALSAKGKWNWKISANQHVAALLRAQGVQLTARTPTGLTKVNKEILEGLVEIPAVREVLRFRENDKLISTFIWPLFDHELADGSTSFGFADEDSRVHPIWSIHKISGRWGSSDPVCSNIPKSKIKKMPDGSKKLLRPNIRRQYTVRKGRKFVGFDFGQLEARILAMISRDSFLCDVFGRGLDIHREAARIIWPEFDSLNESLQKQLRDNAKPFEYGAFYGADPSTLYKQLLKEGYNITEQDVFKAYFTLMGKMQGVATYQQNIVDFAMKPPYTLKTFLMGRQRIFPLGNPDRNECLNWPSQAAAADIMNSGMSRMMERIVRYNRAFPILQIHDAAVFECWEDDAEAILMDVIECFTQEYTIDSVTIKFPVDAKIADSWADC